MRVHALLSWYDERPAFLAATVASCAAFCDHVTALDGAYGLYPQGRAQSPPEQAETILSTARTLGMGATVVAPATVWRGNEVEKRSALFRVAESLSSPDDWYFVIDGDEVVTDAGGDVRGRLAAATEDVGIATLWQYRPHYAPEERPFVTDLQEEQAIRVFFRAIRGLRVEGRHYYYVTPDGRYLWGDQTMGLGAVADMTTVRLEHRNKQRDLWRAQQARDYYARRDDLGIEGQ